MLVSSPHTWGCFRLFFISFILRYVFPTRVGVFLIGVPFVGPEIGLPHTRGGVSVISALFQRRPPSSPHAWGCFYRAESQPDGIIVFPTRVGVFLVHGEDSTVAPCLPHTRGGVSTSRRPRQGDHVSSPTRVQLAVELTDAGSSPHVWGCFFITCERIWLYPVFPTCVEVFSPFK